MIEVKIPQEISQYEAKMVGPFTIRQAVCGGIGILLSWGIYNGLANVLPRETLVGIIFVLCVPLALIGWIKPYGMRFEKFFMGVLFNTLISSSKRFFKSSDTIANIEKDADKSGPDEITDLAGRKRKVKRKPKKTKAENPKKMQKKYKKYTYA